MVSVGRNRLAARSRIVTFNIGVLVFEIDGGNTVTFEVGFVPEGWTRGQPVRVMKAKAPWPGFVSLDHTKLSLQANIASDAVGLVTFTAEESVNLDSWLEWWNSPQPEQRHTG